MPSGRWGGCDGTGLQAPVRKGGGLLFLIPRSQFFHKFAGKSHQKRAASLQAQMKLLVRPKKNPLNFFIIDQAKVPAA